MRGVDGLVKSHDIRNRTALVRGVSGSSRTSPHRFVVGFRFPDMRSTRREVLGREVPRFLWWDGVGSIIIIILRGTLLFFLEFETADHPMAVWVLLHSIWAGRQRDERARARIVRRNANN